MSNNELLRDSRHINKAFYLMVDPAFYERFDKHYVPTDELRNVVNDMILAGGSQWEIHRDGVWSHVLPKVSEQRLAAQGWKIHVSTTPSQASGVLARICNIALARNTRFKFANDLFTQTLMTSKRWSRGGAGKFITIYPNEEDDFIPLLTELAAELQEDEGPYILSDRRVANCKSLYYRYGGLAQEYAMNIMGIKIPVINSPTGEQLQDDRSPFFQLPPWVSDPFNVPASEVPLKNTLNQGEYEIVRALAFSNTGGVYLAKETASERQVVIKEARPFTEIDQYGHDAIFRLQREFLVLQMVKGRGVAPRPIKMFNDWEHSYLVEEYLDAYDLREVMLINSPLLLVNPTTRYSERFFHIYRRVFTSLLRSVDAIHKCGVVLGDLSAVNVLVDKSLYSIYLIDFEGAYRPNIDDSSDIYTPGFRGLPGQRKGAASTYSDDMYAVAALMVYCIFPIVALSALRKDVFSTVFPVLLKDVGWNNSNLKEIVAGLASTTLSCEQAISMLSATPLFEQPLSSGRPANEMALQQTVNLLGEFIIKNYRTQQPYSLFPSDPIALHTNTLSLGFGSAGIVYALTKCGFAIPAEAEARFERELGLADAADIPPGYLTGSAGLAAILLELGRIEDAHRFLGFANASSLCKSHHSYYYGMAGIGMSNLLMYKATRETHYLEHALLYAEALRGSAREENTGVSWPDGETIHVGLGYGQSGPALFLLRLSQLTGDGSWKEFGRRALNFDLSLGHAIEPGVISFPRTPDDHIMYEQYIEEGSAGIAKVAIRYGMWEHLDPILNDLNRKYSGFAGMIYGLSGFVDVLVDAYVYSGNERYLTMTERALAGLDDLYLLDREVGLATPGENMFRISCDYATGSAGVMLSLQRRISLALDHLTLDDLDNIG